MNIHAYKDLYPWLPIVAIEDSIVTVDDILNRLHGKKTLMRKWRTDGLLTLMSASDAYYLGTDDTSQHWLSFLISPIFEKYSRRLLGIVQKYQKNILKSKDPLVQYELNLINSSRHPRDKSWLCSGGMASADFPGLGITRRLSETTYQLLSVLCRQPDINGISMRGKTCLHALRIACMEQLNRYDMDPDKTFTVNVLDLYSPTWYDEVDYDSGWNRCLSRLPGWMSQVLCFEEGLRSAPILLDNSPGEIDQEYLDRQQDDLTIRVHIFTSPFEGRMKGFRWFIHGNNLRIAVRENDSLIMVIQKILEQEP
ncbi:MAG: hypothetical protein GY779_04420 [Gammaproteobacteria bacterium]|nr:hypothetical protein [Gammaproteobacteria bacterium]